MRWRAERGWAIGSRRLEPRRGVGGHSLVEVVVSLVLVSLVMGAAYAVLLAQRRFYSLATRTAEARDVSRIALQVLAGELRGTSPAAGDLYAMAADSVSLRSTTAVATLCEASGTTLRVRRLGGAFGDRPADSALVYLEGDTSSAVDDQWVAVRVQALAGGGTGDCYDKRPPDLALTVDRPVAGLLPGAPVRGFRPYTYKLYAGAAGRWWLGQRLRGGVIQPLTGPFAAPGAGGLRFEFLTASGSAAARPEEVAQVRIEVEAVRRGTGRLSPARRSMGRSALSTVVYLRSAR